MTDVLHVLDRIAYNECAAPPPIEELRDRGIARKRRRQRSTGVVASIAIVGIGIGAIAVGTQRQPSSGEADGGPAESSVDARQAPEPEGTSPPVDAPAVEAVDEVPEGFIPPPVNSNDSRDPIQRFLNVPVDPVEATQWTQTATDQAVTECMAERGYSYEESTSESQVLDPLFGENPAFFEDLDGPEGCREWATRQTNLFPDGEEQFALLQQLISADPIAVEATSALQDCLAANDAVDSITVPEACATVRAVWDRVHVDLMEEYAPAWSFENRDTLEDLRDRIAGLVERADG